MSRRRNEQGEEDLRYVLADRRGRRWVAEVIFRRCGLANAIDLTRGATVAAALEGRRSIASDLAAEIEALDPMLWAQLVDERARDKVERSRQAPQNQEG